MTKIEETIEHHLRDRALNIAHGDLVHVAPSVLERSSGRRIAVAASVMAVVAVLSVLAAVLTTQRHSPSPGQAAIASSRESFVDASFLNTIAGPTWKVVKVTDRSGISYDIDPAKHTANFTVDPKARQIFVADGIYSFRSYSEDKAGRVDFGPVEKTLNGFGIITDPLERALLGGIGSLLDDVTKAHGELSSTGLIVYVDGYTMTCLK